MRLVDHKDDYINLVLELVLVFGDDLLDLREHFDALPVTIGVYETGCDQIQNSNPLIIMLSVFFSHCLVCLVAVLDALVVAAQSEV